MLWNELVLGVHVHTSTKRTKYKYKYTSTYYMCVNSEQLKPRPIMLLLVTQSINRSHIYFILY